jgi:hypothetical protein
VKLHDRSCDGTLRGSGGVDWPGQLDELSLRYGVHIAKERDAAPYLFVSDLVITDHSSVGFEFMLLDRPLIVIDCPELIHKACVSPDKVIRLRRAADVITDPRALDAAVTRALATPGRRSQERRTTAAELFYGAGGATARAVSRVYDVLNLEPPTSAVKDGSISDAEQNGRDRDILGQPLLNSGN